MPKVEREKLVADREELQKMCSQRILDLRTTAYRIRAAFVDSFSHCKIISNYLLETGAPDIHVKVRPVTIYHMTYHIHAAFVDSFSHFLWSL